MKDKKDKTEVDVSFVDKQPPYLSVEDPGFPQGGGANPSGGTPTYNLAKFSHKLHEIEKNSDSGGRGQILLCRSATAYPHNT